MKKCILCNNIYNENSNRQKRCITCKNKYNTIYQKNYSSLYYKNNIDKLKIYNHNYYILNNEKIKQNVREYELENKKQCQQRYRIRQQYKYHNDKSFRFRMNLTHTIVNRIKYHKGIKKSKTEILLGCNIKQLKQHLENKFQNGMSWSNYGEWHIDHIIPCCRFDLTKEEEQKQCFHYTNLQPLWAIDNLKKSNKLEVIV